MRAGYWIGVGVGQTILRSMRKMIRLCARPMWPFGATWYILVFGQALGGMHAFPKVTHGEPKCIPCHFGSRFSKRIFLFDPPTRAMWATSAACKVKRKRAAGVVGARASVESCNSGGPMQPSGVPACGTRR